MARHPDSPHYFGALDRVMRLRDSMRGKVVYSETLYAVVSWEDGATEVVDQFDHAVVVEGRGPLGGALSSELSVRLANLEEELEDVEGEIEEAQRRQSRIEGEISEIEGTVEEAKEAEARLAMQTAQAAQLLADYSTIQEVARV